jgi:uncharacterized protein YdbL (DUF1318 family)
VLSLRLSADSPLVVSGSHTGSANFIVELVGRGPNAGRQEVLFNEIGRYAGQTAVAEVSSGPYRVSVNADGSWVLRFQQPLPTGSERHVLGVMAGRGARVIPVKADHDLQPVVTATHHGQANFVVNLIGYGNTTGEQLLFNEIGNFRGQTLVDDMPDGPYLLHVQADGKWLIRFTP